MKLCAGSEGGQCIRMSVRSPMAYYLWLQYRREKEAGVVERSEGGYFFWEGGVVVLFNPEGGFFVLFWGFSGWRVQAESGQGAFWPRENSV